MKEFLKKFFDRTFWRFLLVGAANTLFGSAVMFLCYNLFHLSYWVSSAANYVFGSILSYFLNKYYTFRKKERSLGMVVRFVLNISLCYLIAYGAAKPLMARLLSGFGVSVQENGAMLVGMGLFVILNYCGQRFFAFRDRKGQAGEKEEK